MSDYTPNEEEAREAIDEWMWSRRMWRPECSMADGHEFYRFITEVKADALREAAGDLLGNPPSVDIFGKPLPGHIEAQRRLLATADRIESGDGQ